MSTAPAPSAAPAAGPSAGGAAPNFADDPRVHYDRTSGTWKLEDEDGNEMEYEMEKGVWVPVARGLLIFRIK